MFLSIKMEGWQNRWGCFILTNSFQCFQSSSKKTHMSDLNKLETLLHKTHIKVLLLLRHQGLTCVVGPHYH